MHYVSVDTAVRHIVQLGQGGLWWQKSTSSRPTGIYQSILRTGVAWSIHNIYAFLTAGPPGSDQCQAHLDKITETCNILGLPLKAEKVEGIHFMCTITFLGIILIPSRWRFSFLKRRHEIWLLHWSIGQSASLAGRESYYPWSESYPMHARSSGWDGCFSGEWSI